MNHEIKEHFTRDFCYNSYVTFHGKNIWEPQHDCAISISICLFDLILYVPIKSILVRLGKVLLVFSVCFVELVLSRD